MPHYRMSVPVNLSAYARVPYLAEVARRTDRVVNISALWDGQSWHLWVPQPSGDFFPMRPAEMAQGPYVAKTAAREADLYFPFLDFMWQRASWPKARHWLVGIGHDLELLAASIATIDFLWAKRDEVPSGSLGLSYFLSGELEHIVTVCRSVLDELQEILRAIWEKITLTDPVAERRKKRDLKKSFADMALHSDGSALTWEQIQDRQRIPRPLAEAYASAALFCQKLKGLRDDIVHQGHETALVLVTPRGFAISKTAKHFSALGVWADGHALNENLFSLRPVLAYLIAGTLRTCNLFAEVLGRHFAMPEPVLVPDYRYFFRSVHSDAILRTLAVANGGSPWWEP